VSIVRVGLAETQKFSEGYEAIFGKKTAEGQAAATAAKKAGGAKKAPAKKKTPAKKAPAKKKTAKGK
jgi:hypothetical protein